MLAVLVTSMLQFTFNANTSNILTLQHCRGLVKRSLLVRQRCLQAQILQILQMDGFEHTKYLICWLYDCVEFGLLQLIFAFKRLLFFPLIFFANSGLAIVRQDNGVCGGLDYFMRVNLESDATTSPLVAIQLCYSQHHRHHL